MKITAGILVLSGLLALLFFVIIPGKQDGIRLRIDFAMTFLRGVVDPVGPVPTSAAPTTVEGAAALPGSSATPTFSASPTTTQTEVRELTPDPTATTTHTPTVTFTPTPPPPKMVLEAPAYEEQDINNCGPATLAMYLRYYGWEGDQVTIADEVKPVREDRNVNVEELHSFMLTQVGWLESQYRVGGDLMLLRRLLASGFPVMIEESMIMAENYWPNDDRWSGHYLLLTGYDDEREVFITQDSFIQRNRVVSYADLDKNWKAFNRVYILVYPIDRRAQIQDILGSNWDPDENRRHALAEAERETELDSTDSYAWFNLGSNLVYFERYPESAKAYDTARNLGLPQRMLRYQFGPFFAYFHAGRIDDLLALTEYALKRTPNAEEAMLWRGWAFYRQGNRLEAVSLFQEALQVHPGYTDAQYALEFVQNN